MFWPSREEARRQVQAALPHVTVAVGNLDECDTAVGEREPHRGGRGAARLRRGPGRRQAGPRRRAGARTATGSVEVPPVPVEVVNGLGAGRRVRRRAVPRPAGRLGRSSASLRFANAAGAIVAARLACSDAMPTTAEVEALLAEARRCSLTELRRGHPRPGSTTPRPIAEAAARRVARRPRSLGPRRPPGASSRPTTRPAARCGPAASGWPWPTGPGCWSGCASRWAGPGVDGVLGTADVLEDLLLLGALDGKVVIGSMNRGGLAGTVFEIDDRFTGYDAAAIEAHGLRGRQDAAAHRPRRPGHRGHPPGLRHGRERPGRHGG